MVRHGRLMLSCYLEPEAGRSSARPARLSLTLQERWPGAR